MNIRHLPCRDSLDVVPKPITRDWTSFWGGLGLGTQRRLNSVVVTVIVHLPPVSSEIKRSTAGGSEQAHVNYWFDIWREKLKLHAWGEKCNGGRNWGRRPMCTASRETETLKICNMLKKRRCSWKCYGWISDDKKPNQDWNWSWPRSQYWTACDHALKEKLWLNFEYTRENTGFRCKDFNFLKTDDEDDLFNALEKADKRTEKLRKTKSRIRLRCSALKRKICNFRWRLNGAWEIWYIQKQIKRDTVM